MDFWRPWWGQIMLRGKLLRFSWFSFVMLCSVFDFWLSNWCKIFVYIDFYRPVFWPFYQLWFRGFWIILLALDRLEMNRKWPEMDRKWTGNEPEMTGNESKMNRKWTGNGSEMDRKWTGNGPEMNRKWIGNKSEMDRKWIGNESEMDRKWIENEPEMDRKWTGNESEHLHLHLPFYLPLKENKNVAQVHKQFKKNYLCPVSFFWHEA